MDGNKQEAALGAGAAHSEALNFIVNTILAQKPELSAQLTAIGHRIVHGGEKYTSSVAVSYTHLENVSEHSLQVAMVAHALAAIKNRKFGGNVNAERIALLAMYHDASEVLTGDLPRCV